MNPFEARLAEKKKQEEADRAKKVAKRKEEEKKSSAAKGKDGKDDDAFKAQLAMMIGGPRPQATLRKKPNKVIETGSNMKKFNTSVDMSNLIDAMDFATSKPKMSSRKAKAAQKTTKYDFENYINDDDNDSDNDFPQTRTGNLPKIEEVNVE